jgi:(1->4)-alpha-D-glucan 1-alpha-D-glucosylmutase
MERENQVHEAVLSFSDALVKEMERRRNLPESTYRVQFHAGFTFRDAMQIVPYLHGLGITHLYASPFLQARAGSTHGYDITNHNTLNPEIGTEADYEALCDLLQQHGMGQILDIVPNHMGITGNANDWWRDVLENGPSSPYDDYFDIAWYASPRVEMHEKILLPTLGKAYGEALESGEIRLEYAAGAFTIRYFDHCFPVAPHTYPLILERRPDELVTLYEKSGEALAEYDSIITAIKYLPMRSETDPARKTERQREKEVIKRRLTALIEAQPEIGKFIQDKVALFNGRAGDPPSFDRLDELLREQVYRLCHWQVASEEVNYRRFFDINDLAALSMEKPQVFTATHALILRLLREGKVHGVRIDHPDGLYDPEGYFRRLQQEYVRSVAARLVETDSAHQAHVGRDVEALLSENGTGELPKQLRHALYIVVEKILGVDEALRQDWAVYGTSGYDFLNVLNGLFIASENQPAFTRLYREWTDDPRSFADVVYDSKRLIMQVSLSSELHMLAHQLDRLAQKNRRSRDFTFNSLRYALQEVIACFPVYRSYITSEDIHPDDRRYVQQAIARAQRRNPAISREIFAFVRDMLLLDRSKSAGEEARAEQLRFAGKFQQVTAPVMAKGLEDTAFYNYTRLLSLNEVGNDAGRFGVSPQELHRYFQDRQSKWPWALSGLSTHDTKRSEDVRARLNVLSELPDEWEACAKRWSELNARHRHSVDDEPVPDASVEYLLYQTLVGAWPLEPYSAEDYGDFIKRIQAYMLKALHEAKTHSSWTNPNEAYDQAVQHYVASILDSRLNGAFVEDLRKFEQRVSHLGLLNSLAQTLLRITAPGVPDTYQGTEVWDFSLVDPDNRRPVGYGQRQKILQELGQRTDVSGGDRTTLAAELLHKKEDGRIKMYVTAIALDCRRRYRSLFTCGAYRPNQAQGAKREHVFAFTRSRGDHEAIVVVPRLIARLLRDQHELPLGASVWNHTSLVLSNNQQQRSWRNLFTGESITAAAHQPVPVAEILAQFPVALLIDKKSCSSPDVE